VIVTDAGGRKQTFDVSNAGSYLSANDSRLLIGLGKNTSVKSIEIRWTSGRIQKLENPAIDRYHLVREK
jgi:enediyne biosynthesis protein E4